MTEALDTFVSLSERVFGPGKVTHPVGPHDILMTLREVATDLAALKERTEQAEAEASVLGKAVVNWRMQFEGEQSKLATLALRAQRFADAVKKHHDDECRAVDGPVGREMGDLVRMLDSLRDAIVKEGE